jgi:UDP-N-acetylmuramoyl-tripeptide--D-alanyl-D-alanine ligase
MAEIGPSSTAAHAAVGRHCAAVGVDVLVAVGPAAAPIADAASDAGVTDVRRVPDAHTAGDVVADLVDPGDTVLVKASRVVGLEAVTAALAAGGRSDPGAVVSPADGEAPR